MKRPFHRAIQIALAIQSALRLPANERAPLLAGIPEYKSRGHGRGTPPRRYGNKPGKYTPHQGKQECARRVRQAEEAFFKRLNAPV